MHDGHRDRLREKYTNYGIDNLAEHEVLEMLLYFSIPRKDMNKTAHRLINAFGSFSAVFEAKPEDLKTVHGIGDKSAELISYIGALIRIYEKDKTIQLQKSMNSQSFSDRNVAGEYIKNLFLNERNETLYLVFLNARKKLIYHEKIAEGTIDSVEIYSRNIIKSTFRANAHSVILAHNHLSGNPSPSNADIETTRVVKKTLNLIGVQLIDHFIVGGNNFLSLKEAGIVDF